MTSPSLIFFLAVMAICLAASVMLTRTYSSMADRSTDLASGSDSEGDRLLILL